MKAGDIVIGKITNIVGYGAFVSLGEYEGLIHISEFSDSFVKNNNDYVKTGDEVRLRVLEVNDEAKQVKLSYKQLHKTRGVKCRIPEYKIGFKSLADCLDDWIDNYKGLEEEENENKQS